MSARHWTCLGCSATGAQADDGRCGFCREEGNERVARSRMAALEAKR
jgi:hypothetical protein